MKNGVNKFDDWFADSFPEYVYSHGKRFLDPYYSIAQTAYDKGLEDGAVDNIDSVHAKGKKKRWEKLMYEDIQEDTQILERVWRRFAKNPDVCTGIRCSKCPLSDKCTSMSSDDKARILNEEVQ